MTYIHWKEIPYIFYTAMQNLQCYMAISLKMLNIMPKAHAETKIKCIFNWLSLKIKPELSNEKISIDKLSTERMLT